MTRAITREIAAYACGSRYSALPDVVQRESARAFLNWMGCTLGGCREPAVIASVAVAEETGGAPHASLIGLGRRTDIVNAAFVNCLSSATLAYDDTHLATVTHPTGPVAAALFAWSEMHVVSGEDFLNALALGIEIQCRMSNVLLLAPAKANLSLYVTGLTGPIGAAAALGRVMGLDEETMRWAIGLAAAQAAGFRATHASMAGAFPPAHAARAGVLATLLAQKGFSTSDRILEADKGFVDIFSTGADLNHAVDGLGARFEMLTNAYKPYPSGIVVQPAIDACLDIAERLPAGAKVSKAVLRVHPLTIMLANRTHPRDFWEAQISVQHWASVALLRRSVGVAAVRQSCIEDAEVAALRAKVETIADPAIGRDEAIVEVVLEDGAQLRAHVVNARGSIARPMTDAELDEKFRALAQTALDASGAERLVGLCRNAASLTDIGKQVSAVWMD